MKKLLCIVLLAVACREESTSRQADESTSPVPVETSTTRPPDDSTISPSTTRPLDDSTTRVDPTGAYFAMDELPADFAELEHLSLATIDENAAPAPLNGFLRPKDRNAQDYVLVNPTLAGQHLRFRTATVDGVVYEFEGDFAVTGDLAANPPPYETAALTGTLTKLRDGKIVASVPVRFRYEAGG